MAGKTRYKILRKVLVEEGREVMHQNEIMILIKKNLASHEKEAISAFKMMIETGLIKELENLKYQIQI